MCIKEIGHSVTLKSLTTDLCGYDKRVLVRKGL